MPDDVEQAARPPAAPSPEPDPVASLLDPRALQILTAEHGSLLSARSLAYNESFTRGGMFLTFLSLSFVALALLAQALPIDRGFLVVAAILLGFDLVVGITTFGRIVGASYEDYLAVQGMARIRHGYGEIAPVVLPYFTTGTHDDMTGVMVSYGSPPNRGLGAVAYQLTTSAGMINLIVSMVGGVLALVLAVISGTSVAVAFVVAAVATLGLFLALGFLMVRFYLGVQARIPVLFPTPPGR
jgi:hypothetical protein